jgi:regulatory protein
VAARPDLDGPTPGSAADDTEPADPEQVARTIVLRQLSAAPRSRAELEQALRKRGVPEEVAASVLDRFTELGYVDDAAYAAMLVRARHGERGLARRALGEELRRKGVDADVAAAAVAAVSTEDEEAAARRLAAKKMRAMTGLPAETQVRRLAGLLGRKGYPPAVALRVAREAVSATGSDAVLAAGGPVDDGVG